MCDKWFCEKHLEPKFPYMRDPEGYLLENHPEIRALYYFEYHREDGRPDFIYFRKKIEAQKLEEKTRDLLIKQGLDKMESKWRSRARRKRDTRTPKQVAEDWERRFGTHKRSNQTAGNKHGMHFEVPTEVYSDPKYRERLDNAATLYEVDQIVAEYHKRDQKEPPTEDNNKQKRKHWWQKGN